MANKYIFYTILILGFYYTDARPKKPEPEFCSRGFQLSSKYYTCWKDATYEHRFPALEKSITTYTHTVLEQYALHMCSVVKPTALECFSKEISACANKATLYKMADISGGTCLKNSLDPAFKSLIIDRVKPVRIDSHCFDIADDARLKCYDVGKYIPPGAATVDIGHFSEIANKLFSYIWQCHVTMFRKLGDRCPAWQMPMLFSLQQTAMPSLFGMHLSRHQVAMLELGGPSGDDAQETKEDDCKDDHKTLLLMRVIEDREEADREGDIVMEVGGGGMTSGVDTSEAVKFYNDVITAKGGINMRLLRERAREMRKERKEKKKEAKEIKEFLTNMKKEH